MQAAWIEEVGAVKRGVARCYGIEVWSEEFDDADQKEA